MQLEPIINARFKKFRDSYDLQKVQDGIAFEKFVNHTILTAHQPDAFSADTELLDSVCVGGEWDMGIDGMAIKLNGLLIKSIEEANDIIQKFKRANLEFIFIQSKYKHTFDSGEFNKFISGVRDFLSDQHLLPMNDQVKEMLEIKDYLLNDIVDTGGKIMWDKNPSVRLYFVAMGKWKSQNTHLLGLAEHAKNDITRLNIYDSAEVHFIDSEALKNICDSNERSFTETILTDGVLPLTEVEGVENSCLALCYAGEFVKLLTTEDGVIRKSLFEDNVRDFQGENQVNTEIENTILKDPSKFILLNNGITIVCDKFIQNNRKLTIEDPQIVNGCQTSHVIFYAHKKGMDISRVPINIKIIATTDYEISNQIVRGNNKQNIVLEEAFETTKQFHKDLEQFFNAVSSEKDKIYYERRSKQYSNTNIKQTQKINMRILLQSFVGMFLNKPETAHRHESVLLREFENEVFQEKQSKTPYYVAALTFYRLEKLYRDGEISKELYAFRAQLSMLFRQIIAGDCPSINFEKGIDEHCDILLKVLNDEKSTGERFKQAIDFFEGCKQKWVKELKKSPFSMKDVADFTSLLLTEARKEFGKQTSNLVEDEKFVYTGVVLSLLTDKWGKQFGFIKRQPANLFFHSNSNRYLKFDDLKGKSVTYRIETNPKDQRLFAVDVKIVD